VPGQLRQPRAHEAVDVVAVDVREERLPERRRMHRQKRADFEQLQARVRPKHVMDDQDAAGVRDADADRLADAGREQL
jgi:hypothetical protein